MACISNSGYKAAAGAQADAIYESAIVDIAIQVVLHAAKRNATNSITGMIQNIASRKLALAQAVHDHAKKFWPCEKTLVEEAFFEQKHEPRYSDTASGWGGITDNVIYFMTDLAYKTTVKNCARMSNCELSRLNANGAKQMADIKSYAYRYSETLADALNDSRYAKQYAAVSLSRNVLQTVEAFQALAGFAGRSAAESMTSLVSNGLTALGYYRNRAEGQSWNDSMRMRAVQQFEPMVQQRAKMMQGGGTGLTRRAPFAVGGAK